jgi:hypothetical protein
MIMAALSGYNIMVIDQFEYKKKKKYLTILAAE